MCNRSLGKSETSPTPDLWTRTLRSAKISYVLSAHSMFPALQYLQYEICTTVCQYSTLL